MAVNLDNGHALCVGLLKSLSASVCAHFVKFVPSAHEIRAYVSCVIFRRKHLLPVFNCPLFFPGGMFAKAGADKGTVCQRDLEGDQHTGNVSLRGINMSKNKFCWC